MKAKKDWRKWFKLYQLPEPMSPLEVADYLIQVVGKEVVQAAGGDFYLPAEKNCSGNEKPGEDWIKRQAICLMSVAGTRVLYEKTQSFFLNLEPRFADYHRAAEQLVENFSERILSQRR